MATPKSAKVVELSGGDNGRHIVCTFSPEDAAAFVAGKFIIVDTGLKSPDGKAIKRAYSLLSVDQQNNQFALLVKRLGQTPGANYMHQLKQEDTLTFSGPWGKFNDDGRGEGPIWIIATDTGFTACHGWMRSSARAPQVKFFWLREDRQYLDISRAHSYEVIEIDVPPVGVQDRIQAAWDALASQLDQPPKKVFMAGDGDLLLRFRDEFLQLGLTSDDCVMELFFNNPAKKSAAL